MSTAAASDPGPAVTVYFDGACPVCSREIAMYRRRRGAERVAWINVHSAEFIDSYDLNRADALARFHVRRADGSLTSGVDAFRELWSQLPAWRWLAFITRPRLVRAALERAYGMFLAIRGGGNAVAFSALPTSRRRDLASNHAGELGAVAIYRGILLATRDPDVRSFAQRHLATEKTHLDLMRGIVPVRSRSILSPIWAVAGYVTGVLAALAGRQGVMVTIDAVESFVDEHYRHQLDEPACSDFDAEVAATIARCHSDELEHRDEARRLIPTTQGPIAQAWTALVALGSRAAVRVARIV